jgi:hypothetical protein
MRAVSRFEADLLRILHCLLQRAPLEQALPLLLAGHVRPPCLGRAAVELVQDALGKGCVRLLARRGGWRRERHLRAERVVEGRLWERTPPEELGLAFSRATLEFLVWLTETDFREEEVSSWSAPADGLTLGDRSLLLFAHEALHATGIGKVLRAQPAFANDGLCWLLYPDQLARPAAGVAPDLSPWMQGVGPCLLEAFQPGLAERWLAIERGKRTIGDGARMRALGQSQGCILDAFLGAVDAAGRRDLARFLLVVAAHLLRDSPTADDWIGALDLEGFRLAERAEVYRAALVVLQRLDQLRRWDQQARTIGYFDEGYSAGQWWKAEWERHEGDALWARAQAILREVEPLHVGTEEHPLRTQS